MFGYQNPAHLYYVHFAPAKNDPNADQVFIVNDADRKMITDKDHPSPGIDWGDQKTWHRLKIVRKVNDGLIEAYFDDMEKPIETAHDKTFTWGRIGIGTFDDTADFAEVKLWGEKVKPAAANVDYPDPAFQQDKANELSTGRAQRALREQEMLLAVAGGECHRGFPFQAAAGEGDDFAQPIVGVPHDHALVKHFRRDGANWRFALRIFGLSGGEFGGGGEAGGERGGPSGSVHPHPALSRRERERSTWREFEVIGVRIFDFEIRRVIPHRFVGEIDRLHQAPMPAAGRNRALPSAIPLKMCWAPSAGFARDSGGSKRGLRCSSSLARVIATNSSRRSSSSCSSSLRLRSCGKMSFFHAIMNTTGNLQPFGGMHGHQRDPVVFHFPGVGVVHQGRLFQKRFQARRPGWVSSNSRAAVSNSSMFASRSSSSSSSDCLRNS